MKYEEYKVRVYENGNVFWYNKEGQRHRLGGLPAIEGKNVYKAYWENGKLHNLSGPAKVHPNGGVEYWIEGKEYTKEAWEKEVEKHKNPSISCEGKEVVIEGKKYRLVPAD